MRRGTRKAVINLGLFVSAIIVLLYLNSAPPNGGNHSLAWTTVRYQSSNDVKIKPRGSCPGLSETKKPALVVARTSDEDTNWLDGLKTKYHLCVYTVDVEDTTSSYLQVPANRGHESMPYLTFIIDNYDDIPAAGAVFVHGSRIAWHNDHPQYDNAKLLATLNIQTALETNGYHNLRCDWSASTCSPKEALPQGSYETRSRAMLEPWNERVVSDAALPGAFAAIFGGLAHSNKDPKVHLGRNDPLRAQCCAQFVVSRDSILQHSRDEYAAIRQWLLDGSDGTHKSVPGASSPDDRIAGRVLSYLWHVLFIKHDPSQETLDLEKLNEAGCPTAAECYCKLYGRCDLICNKPGNCQGQYRLPPDFKVPKDIVDAS
ncbi:uncharacterized protein PV09_04534 [Verruconis gallopava]|uniref:Uncharacterized protein n=1 Tax=Verruconis gallopava TaxID=253628 RepID=A0A0D2ABM8_9PEZI|nr:uncharacterized protein PV09_04534 [Verruconis gallopava]KIW04228.1 hypothetical protein PV09_04534 [Verruconis gallopava]